MITRFEFENSHLNLTYTLECGQCFRWKQLEDGYYYGVADHSFVKIRQNGTHFEGELACETEANPQAALQHYFSLDQDEEYRQITARLKTDEHITRAIKRYYGLRLLRQPAFEILISFILSANNSIPAVSRAVQSISYKVSGQI